MGLLNRAVGVLSGVAAAGKSVASEIVSATSRPPERPQATAEAAPPATAAPKSRSEEGLE
jgi:hypothetical protein